MTLALTKSRRRIRPLVLSLAVVASALTAEWAPANTILFIPANDTNGVAGREAFHAGYEVSVLRRPTPKPKATAAVRRTAVPAWQPIDPQALANLWSAAANNEAARQWAALAWELAVDLIGPGPRSLEHAAAVDRDDSPADLQTLVAPEDWDLYCELAIPVHIGITSPDSNEQVKWPIEGGNSAASVSSSEVQAWLGLMSPARLWAAAAAQPSVQFIFDTARSTRDGLLVTPLRLARRIPAVVNGGEKFVLTPGLEYSWFDSCDEAFVAAAGSVEPDAVAACELSAVGAVSDKVDVDLWQGDLVSAFRFPVTYALVQDMSGAHAPLVNRNEEPAARLAALEDLAAATRPVLRGVANWWGDVADGLRSLSFRLGAAADAAADEELDYEITQQPVTLSPAPQAALNVDSAAAGSDANEAEAEAGVAD